MFCRGGIHAARGGETERGGRKLMQADCSLVGSGRHKSAALLTEEGKAVGGDRFPDSRIHCFLSGKQNQNVPQLEDAVCELICAVFAINDFVH